MTQNRKLLISSSKMRNYKGKKCEQSLYLSKILNFHPENNFKPELFHWKRNLEICNCKNIILQSVGENEKVPLFNNPPNETIIYDKRIKDIVKKRCD